MLERSAIGKGLIVCAIALSLAGCERAAAVKPDDPTSQARALPPPDTRLSEINLAAIGRIAPKGRVQESKDEQALVVGQLLAHGKESIPYLISQLDDETEIKGHVMDYWSDVRVGDVAFIILTDFFTDQNWKQTTIPGLGWDEFLGGGDDDASLTGEQRLRDYISRRGRKSIKERWLRVWEQHRENIFWDDEERCFISKNTH